MTEGTLVKENAVYFGIALFLANSIHMWSKLMVQLIFGEKKSFRYIFTRYLLTRVCFTYNNSYYITELGWSDRKKIRSWSKIRSWCDRGSFFSKISDHDLIWLEITFYDDLIEKPDHFPDHFSSICYYLKSQFGNNFQKNF